MGYYSEVCIAIDPAQLQKDMFLQKDIVPPEFEVADNWDKRNSGLWIYYLENVKWYPDRPSVIKIEKYLEKLGDTHYFFLQVGETEGDIEQRGNLKCYIWAETKIVIEE